MSENEPVNEIIVRGIVVGSFQENCWVIGNRRTGEAICVDPGDEPDEVLAMARDMGVRIKYIANSHAHIDHILGVRAVREATGAKFLLHPGDLEMARNTATMAKGWMGVDIANPPDPDAFLADNDEIDVDGLKLTVLHTPGHTRGSVCFYADGIVFAGDTLFAGLDRPHRPPGRRLRRGDGAASSSGCSCCRTTRSCCRDTWTRRRSATSGSGIRTCGWSWRSEPGTDSALLAVCVR